MVRSRASAAFRLEETEDMCANLFQYVQQGRCYAISLQVADDGEVGNVTRHLVAEVLFATANPGEVTPSKLAILR